MLTCGESYYLLLVMEVNGSIDLTDLSEVGGCRRNKRVLPPQAGRLSKAVASGIHHIDLPSNAFPSCVPTEINSRVH
jgi:hypothetical protein